MTTFTKAHFVIAVPNLQASADFYSDVLGFKVLTVGDTGWCIFERDSFLIMAGECPDAIPPAELGDHSYFAYIVVSGIDELYQNVQAKNVALTKHLRNEPWGMKEFGIRTADGHRMMFGAPIGR